MSSISLPSSSSFSSSLGDGDGSSYDDNHHQDGAVAVASSALSHRQYIFLICLGWISSTLSIIGSLLIVWIARKQVKYQLYHRFLLFLSLADIAVSITAVLQPIFIPPASTSNPNHYIFAIGTTSTCTWLGFMMRFPVTVGIYNAYLSIYYHCRVRYGWKDFTNRHWEYVAHCIAFLLPILFGIVGTMTEAFNTIDVFHICDYGPYPANCNTNTNSDGDDTILVDGSIIPCERGSTYIIQDWIYVTILIIATIIAIGGTISVYIFVRRRSQANIRYAFSNNNNPRRKKGILRSSASTSSLGQVQGDTRVNEVARQAICYAVAYLNGTFWSFASRIIFDTVDNIEEKQGQPGFYSLAILAYIFFPLQGFWNFIIYIRPRIVTWRKIHPQKSFWWAFCKVLSSEEPLMKRGGVRRLSFDDDGGIGIGGGLRSRMDLFTSKSFRFLKKSSRFGLSSPSCDLGGFSSDGDRNVSLSAEEGTPGCTTTGKQRSKKKQQIVPMPSSSSMVSSMMEGISISSSSIDQLRSKSSTISAPVYTTQDMTSSKHDKYNYNQNQNHQHNPNNQHDLKRRRSRSWPCLIVLQHNLPSEQKKRKPRPITSRNGHTELKQQWQTLRDCDDDDDDDDDTELNKDETKTLPAPNSIVMEHCNMDGITLSSISYISQEIPPEQQQQQQPNNNDSSISSKVNDTQPRVIA